MNPHAHKNPHAHRQRPNYSHGRWNTGNPTGTGYKWLVQVYEGDAENGSVIEKYFYSLDLAQAVLQAELKRGRCAVMTQELQTDDDIPF